MVVVIKHKHYYIRMLINPDSMLPVRHSLGNFLVIRICYGHGIIMHFFLLYSYVMYLNIFLIIYLNILLRLILVSSENLNLRLACAVTYSRIL